jgi:ketosteroid isomerase-like protein
MGEDGNPVELAMRSSEVVRRQADGSWRYVIDNPFTPD